MSTLRQFQDSNPPSALSLYLFHPLIPFHHNLWSRNLWLHNLPNPIEHRFLNDGHEHHDQRVKNPGFHRPSSGQTVHFSSSQSTSTKSQIHSIKIQTKSLQVFTFTTTSFTTTTTTHKDTYTPPRNDNSLRLELRPIGSICPIRPL